MELTEALAYSIRVARSLSRDPEAESAAGLAAWNAYRTFDPTLNVPWRRWVAVCTKSAVHDMWKKRQHVSLEVLRRPHECDGDTWTEYEVVAPVDSEPIEGVEWWDWKVLVEHYIDGVPCDVIARNRGVSKREAQQMVRDAVERLRSRIQTSIL